MSKIEPSVENMVDANLLAFVKADQPIVVSGQPLRIFHPTNTEKDTFFTDSIPLHEEILFPPFRVFMQRFGASEANLPDRYLPAEGEKGYPVIQGFTVDGSEVVLGIWQALGFNAKAAPGIEQ